MSLQQILRVAVCAALVALVVAGAGLFSTQPVAGQETRSGALSGAAAIDQLKRDGQYESLKAAMRQARFNASRAEHTSSYPLTIDPLFAQQQPRLTANDGEENDHFGQAIALEGGTVVVGAYWDDIGGNKNQGSAYVFTRSGGVWTEQQKLTANNGAANDGFGSAVALSGDTLAVATSDSPSGPKGSVYVFTRSGATWTQQQRITAGDGVAGDSFGYAIALDGDTLAVGADNNDIGENANQGSAYVFTRINGFWRLQQKIIANDGAANDGFGFAVALDGDTLAVGANKDDIGSNSNQGSAYVFTRSGEVWTQQPKITAADGAAFDIFGWSVALDGDTLAVGAKGDDIGSIRDQGSAYVFTRSGSVWTYQQKLTANDGRKDDGFGQAVALVGDILAVSAYLTDNGERFDEGAAYVFTRANSTWTQRKKLTGGDIHSIEEFGRAVALNNDTVMVGANWEEVNSNPKQGSVYVFANTSCQSLTFAPASLPNGVVGSSYLRLVKVSGGVGPYQFGLSGGALPPGLSLTQHGLLLGTPTTPGEYHFTISATSLYSLCSSSRDYTIKITPRCSTILIDPPELPNGAVGAPYSQTLSVYGDGGSFNFAVKGALPPGLSLSPGGVLSGTPTQAGYFTFTLVASNANGCGGSRVDSITITNEPGDPTERRGKRGNR